MNIYQHYSPDNPCAKCVFRGLSVRNRVLRGHVRGPFSTFITIYQHLSTLFSAGFPPSDPYMGYNLVSSFAGLFTEYFIRVALNLASGVVSCAALFFLFVSTHDSSSAAARVVGNTPRQVPHGGHEANNHDGPHDENLTTGTKEE